MTIDGASRREFHETIGAAARALRILEFHSWNPEFPLTPGGVTLAWRTACMCQRELDGVLRRFDFCNDLLKIARPDASMRVQRSAVPRSTAHQAVESELGLFIMVAEELATEGSKTETPDLSDQGSGHLVGVPARFYRGLRQERLARDTLRLLALPCADVLRVAGCRFPAPTSATEKAERSETWLRILNALRVEYVLWEKLHRSESPVPPDDGIRIQEVTEGRRVDIQKGSKLAQIAGEKRVWLFLSVVDKAPNRVSWDDLLRARHAFDGRETNARVMRQKTKKDWVFQKFPVTPREAKSLQRLGNHVQERLRPWFNGLWCQDGDGAMWVGGGVVRRHEGVGFVSGLQSEA